MNYDGYLDQPDTDTTPRAAKRKPWAPAEIDFLRLHYGKMFVADIAATLGRTKTSVTSAADRLGLAGMARHMRNGAWLEEEIEFLRAHFHTETVDYIVKRLGRSASAVKRKRAALGMPAKPARVIADRPKGDDLLALYGSMTAAQIAEKYGYNKNTVRSWIERTI